MPSAVIIQHVRPRATYGSSESGSVTVPDGATRLVAYVQGAGGASGEGTSFSGLEGGGGGGGAFCSFESDIMESEWGSSITLAIGAGAIATNGGSSILSGTLNGAAFTVTAQGGTKGSILSDGVGGTASGGTVNQNGESGYGLVTSPVDEATGGTGGAGGHVAFGDDGFEAVAGYGGNGEVFGSGIAGFDGFICLEWN